MPSSKLQQRIDYWRKTAAHDYETMNGLFKIKRYSDSLFYGHIVLEKILKGLVVKETKKQAEYTHNLVNLAKDANVNLPETEMKMLAQINRFNIRTRYPDAKLKFYKQCTLDYTKHYLKEIDYLYDKLCQKIDKKK